MHTVSKTLMALAGLMLANAQSGPTAANNFYTVTENMTLNVDRPRLLANDITSNPPLETLLVTGPSDGTVVIPAIDAISNGGFDYTPNFDFIGTDSCLLIMDNYRPAARYGRRLPPDQRTAPSGEAVDGSFLRPQLTWARFPVASTRPEGVSSSVGGSGL